MCGRCPGAGARRDGLSSPGSCRPACSVGARYLPVWLLSLGGSGFGNPDTLAQWSQEALGKGPTNLSGSMFYLFLLATLGVISSAANALGEEIGWRRTEEPTA